jgi:hypothetical protein
LAGVEIEIASLDFFSPGAGQHAAQRFGVESFGDRDDFEISRFSSFPDSEYFFNGGFGPACGGLNRDRGQAVCARPYQQRALVIWKMALGQWAALM